MKILIDAMGGDYAPFEIVKGALLASSNPDTDIALIGNGELILKCLESENVSVLPSNLEIINATEVIEMEDDPAFACRRKKDSSMSVALRMLHEGLGDAVVSAGSTGALLSGATLIVKRIPGIRRAALAPVVPNGSGLIMIIDCGANTDCTPEYLLQFGYMGSYCMEKVYGISNPRVGLLNNGTEPSKGTSLQTSVYSLLEDASSEGKINFVGNIEAKGVMNNECDVVVCDGFSGNILLKSIEGTSSFLFSELKDMFHNSFKTKIGALLLKNDLYKLKDKFNADAVGGTPLLGISKPVIKAHGSSKANAIFNAVKQAEDTVKSNISELIFQNIDSMKIQSSDKNN